MRELALFAGAGGGILGGKLLGWETVCAVELNSYCASVLIRRQNEGTLSPFPIWNDVKTFDGRPWGGVVEVISGGFPCTDISVAGRGAGIEGKESGLWSEMARIISEVRPRFVFVENSPMLISRGLGRVLADLATLGFDAKWGIVGAHHATAPHKRDRIWVLAELCNANRHLKPTMPQHDETSIMQSNVAYTICEQLRTDGCGQAAGEARENQEPRHQRQRIRFDVGECGSDRRAQDLGNTHSKRSEARLARPEQRQERPAGESFDTSHQGSRRQRSNEWFASEPRLDRVANGVAHRVDRLKAIGNGQVPAVVELAWETLRGY